MLRALVITVLSFLLLMVSCESSQKAATENAKEEIAEITWRLDSIQTSPNPLSFVSWNITNNTDSDWSHDSWSLHFNQIAGGPVVKSIPAFIQFNNPGGEYIELTFNEQMDTLKAGATLSFQYQHNGFIKRMSNMPQGIFIVKNGEVHDIKDAKRTGLNHTVLSAINPTSAKDRYDLGASLITLSEEKVQRILPSPNELALGASSVELPNNTGVLLPEVLTNEQAGVIIEQLQHYIPGVIKTNNDGAFVSSSISSDLGQEAYELNIESKGISIIGGDAAGVYYGFQSLIQLINPNEIRKSDLITIPSGVIKDAPRFAYRGYMLDVARNFHKKEKVMEVLDLMSRYKLNKFHFHIMDDEGWRLEIPGLPELTDVGSRRGYTPDESDRLRPAYGSGGNVDNSYSTGYYTREEYIDIIKYATARHIEVIPEIDLPGHARAAIISMRHRYNRLMKAGREAEAEEYMLHDPQDMSKYSSAQNYNDNVINLCRASSYTFIEKVLRETIQMHIDAGTPLKTLHTGGDEVPYGAWQGSPICQSFISDMENLSGTDDLHPNMLYFIRNILNEYDITTAGWEEIVLAHTKDGHNGTAINKDLVGEPMLPYVWNASWGWGREDMAYKLANEGFDAIMCNSSAYYFDLAYDSDPREGGLDWSGLTNAKSAFDLEPLNIMKNAKYDIRGNPLDANYISSKEGLKASAFNNIKGIQAQLWSETIYRAELVDYMTFPKLLGFAQRAWSQATVDYKTEYNDFVNTVGQRELPRLDLYNSTGIQYRIPPPGMSMDGYTVSINTIYPGLELRYEIGGGEPTIKSPLYTQPFTMDEHSIVKAKAFNSIGRGSNTSTIK